MDGRVALPDAKAQWGGAEMSLNVLAYNLKRVMKIIGTVSLLEALTA